MLHLVENQLKSMKCYCLCSGPGSGSMANPVVFEGSEATNVTAYFGSTAILSCKIRNMIEDNPVIIQLLTLPNIVL